MNQYLTHYQSANLSDEEVIQNFIVRKKEYEKVMADIRTTKKGSSFQHYVFIGRRGSGKSTLLRRIQAEVNQDPKLHKEYVVTNMPEELAGIYQLYDLWDYVIRDLNSKGFLIESPDWQYYAGDLKEYTKRLFAEINQTLEKKGKRLILLIDNIDRVFKNINQNADLLREQLMNYNNIRIIGASTIMSDQYWQYDKAFYEFFSLKRLNPLTLEEIKELLDHWAKVKNLAEIEDFLKNHPGKIQAVRMLTDGTPRTMLVFIDMLIHRSDQNGFDYLRKITDEATPIYQERLGKLSPQQQKILVELSFFWEAVGVDSLIQVCKMAGKTISAQLNSLVKDGVIEKIKGETKNNLYRLEERFFNLWLLMTQGGPTQKRNVKYLTCFLENWYDQDELRGVYSEFMEGLKTSALKPAYISSMTHALSNSQFLSLEERDRLIKEVKSLNILEKNWLDHLPEEASSLFSKALNLGKNKKFEEAFVQIDSITQNFPEKHIVYGVLNLFKENYTLAEYHFLIALENEGKNVDYYLGLTYQYLEKPELAKKHFLIAVEKGSERSLFPIAQLYLDQGNYEKAVEYCTKAVDKNDLDALVALVISLIQLNKLSEAGKYCMIAKEKRIPGWAGINLLLSLAQEKDCNDLLETIKEKGDNLSILISGNALYANNIYPEKALDLAEKMMESTTFDLIKQQIYLWNGKFEAFTSHHQALIERLLNVPDNRLAYYLEELLIHNQYNLVKDLFENHSEKTKARNLALPFYYATLNFIDSNHSNLLKMPPEIGENVNDIIEKINHRKKIYYS